MARARNIKPGFYMNENLIECSFAARLLYPGLWMLADREGRLEDRPKKIKMHIFPADSIDVNDLLLELENYGFIKRYEADGKKVISIPNFLTHQSPHGREQDSILPDEDGMYKINSRNSSGMVTGKFTLSMSIVMDEHGTGTEVSELAHDKKISAEPYPHETGNIQEHCQHHASTMQAHLNPSSLNPSSLNPDTEVVTHTDCNLKPVQEKTPAAIVCVEIKKIGIIDVNPAHPKLLELIKIGATVDEFMHAARTAKDKKAGFAYVLGIVEKQRERVKAMSGKLHEGRLPNKQEALEKSNATVASNWVPPELRMRVND